MQFAIISLLLLHCEAFLLAFPISTVIYILFPQFALRSFFIVPYVVDGHSISRMRLLWNFQSYLWNFHSMDNIMRWCIRFNFRPIRVVINLAERQTDRLGTDIMQGRDQYQTLLSFIPNQRAILGQQYKTAEWNGRTPSDWLTVIYCDILLSDIGIRQACRSSWRDLAWYTTMQAINNWNPFLLLRTLIYKISG